MSNIIIMNESYKTVEDMERVMKYGAREGYSDNDCVGWGGFGVHLLSVWTAINDMLFVKKYRNKEGGKQIYHFVITLKNKGESNNERSKKSSRNRNLEACRYIAPYAAKFIYDCGYQTCFFIHDTPGKAPHMHLVINSVSWQTGLKLKNVKSFANSIHLFLRNLYPFTYWEGFRYNDIRYDWW